MNRRSYRKIVSSILAATVVLGGARAAVAMQMTPSQKQEMLEHYERATRAYDIQKYAEAIEEYQKAYEIAGDPAMLYNVAQAYRLNDQLREALHAYRRYLQRSPNARNRDDVERKILDLQATLDTRRKAAEEAAAHPPPVPAPPPAPPPESPPPKMETPPATNAPGNTKRVVGIVVVSVGAAALAAAGASGWLAAKKGDDLTKASMNGEPFDPNLQRSGTMWNNIAIGAAIGGGAAMVIGTVLLIVSGDGGKKEPAVAFVTPVVGGGTVGMGATIAF
jgi:tetratricopeptide (TPR) repeat protein